MRPYLIDIIILYDTIRNLDRPMGYIYSIAILNCIVFLYNPTRNII